MHHEPAEGGTPHPAARPVGGAHVDSGVLQRHVRDHQVPRAQNLDALHAYGAAICAKDREGTSLSQQQRLISDRQYNNAVSTKSQKQ